MRVPGLSDNILQTRMCPGCMMWFGCRTAYFMKIILPTTPSYSGPKDGLWQKLFHGPDITSNSSDLAGLHSIKRDMALQSTRLPYSTDRACEQDGEQPLDLHADVPIVRRTICILPLLKLQKTDHCYTSCQLYSLPLRQVIFLSPKHGLEAMRSSRQASHERVERPP